jgi:hypothetical protein
MIAVGGCEMVPMVEALLSRLSPLGAWSKTAFFLLGDSTLHYNRGRILELLQSPMVCIKQVVAESGL